jgi:hypothetical protein
MLDRVGFQPPGDSMTTRNVQTAIVPQGGGALGAYEYGVLTALYESRPGFRPVAVAGISIGAITATFATVRHRTKITRGPGSRAAGLAMAFKLIEAAQDRWRGVNGPHLVALVRAGATFVNGKLVGRPDDHPQPKTIAPRSSAAHARRAASD